MDTIVEQLLKTTGLTPKVIVAKKSSKFRGFNIEELLYSLVYAKDLKEAGKMLGGYSEVTMRKYCKILHRLYPNKSPSERWYSALLGGLSLKKCADCCEILPYDCYHVDNSRKDKLRKYCIDCCKEQVSLNKDKIKEYYNRYYQANKSDYISRCALRRARKIRATPIWADLHKIKQIYKNCPEGMEVDHIIPLTSELVCGLHVENNLQYLTKSANRQKGNRYD